METRGMFETPEANAFQIKNRIARPFLFEVFVSILLLKASERYLVENTANVKGCFMNESCHVTKENSYNHSTISTQLTVSMSFTKLITVHSVNQLINVNARTEKSLRSIELPAEGVTSVIFDGPILDLLYVTTSRIKLNATHRLEEPKACSIFAVKGLDVHVLL
ncbi:uncharacterized protein LOC107270555 isoform X1 [Cephus cinctus]|uniref:Uncharacterized protein LOC107270555 isoform X1 n=1 Tax=Cephus cinctus TaxID=211228 RepID=A0AAJ7C3S2_CEPCN|nr:uncharacterized protein LOC107270555 isoform X1 [Cephus cinctus]